MRVEDVVEDALRAADAFDPSPDLFERVQRSIEEDAAHRRRVVGTLALVGLGVLGVGVYLAATVTRVDGALEMPFPALEFLASAVMIGIVLVLGPSIRRFGEAYERAVFGSSPATGVVVLRLLDVSYYLIFIGYVMVTLVFDPALEFGPELADWLRWQLVRIGGLLMLMGVLHVAVLTALPVSGLVLAANNRRLRMAAGNPSTDALADRADRTIGVLTWAVAVLAALTLIGWVLNAVLILGLPG